MPQWQDKKHTFVFLFLSCTSTVFITCSLVVRVFMFIIEWFDAIFTRSARQQEAKIQRNTKKEEKTEKCFQKWVN